MKTQKINIKHKNRILNIPGFYRFGRKKPIIFLPGLGCSKDEFLSAFKSGFLKGHSVLVFDMPGSNSAKYPKGAKYGINDLVIIVKKIKEQAGFKKIILVAHSFGGAIGLAYCLRFPKDIFGFINIEGTIDPLSFNWFIPVKKGGVNNFVKNFFPEYKEQLKKSPIRSFRKYAKNLNKADSRAYFDYASSCINFCRKKIFSKFSALKIPKVFIYGTKNQSLDALKLFKRVSQAGVSAIKIPKSGHFPHYDNPRFLFRAIKKFIKNTGN